MHFVMLLTLCLFIWNVQASQARSDEEWTNDCRDVLLSDESGNGQVTLRYLKCMYWAYGFTKQEAETFAKMEFGKR